MTENASCPDQVLAQQALAMRHGWMLDLLSGRLCELGLERRHLAQNYLVGAIAALAENRPTAATFEDARQLLADVEADLTGGVVSEPIK